MTQREGSSSGVSSDELERAAMALLAGRIVCVPTDTVYGLAVDPSVRGATAAVFELKGRPHSLTLPVLVAGTEQADTLADGGLPGVARRVAERFWPGPVTVVVPRRREIDWDLGGDGATIGLRCPAHPIVRQLCARVGPLATTSANPHGEPPLSKAASIRERLGDGVALVVDGGTLSGPASTVVQVSDGGLRCLREGAVGFEELMASLAGDSLL